MNRIAERAPRLGIILGSGLGAVAEALDADRTAIRRILGNVMQDSQSAMSGHRQRAA